MGPFFWPRAVYFKCLNPSEIDGAIIGYWEKKLWHMVLSPIGSWVILTLNIPQLKHVCGAKTAVSWPPEGLFRFCKGQKPSEFNGPINGQV